MVNAMDIYESRKSRIKAKYEAKRKREADIFYSQCLREIKGPDAYKYLVYVAGETLECRYGVPIIVEHFINNRKKYDCSFVEWLNSDNGPICKYSIKGLFPELEVLTNDEYEIIEMANENYGLDIHMDPCGDFVYAFEFSFKEINKKRVNLNELKNKIAESIKNELRGE